MGARSMNCAVGKETSVRAPAAHFKANHGAAGGAPAPLPSETSSYGPPAVLLARATGSELGSFKAMVGSTLSSRPIVGSQSLGGVNVGPGAGSVGPGDRNGKVPPCVW